MRANPIRIKTFRAWSNNSSGLSDIALAKIANENAFWTEIVVFKYSRIAKIVIISDVKSTRKL